jgi:hypothetical protein
LASNFSFCCIKTFDISSKSLPNSRIFTWILPPSIFLYFSIVPVNFANNLSFLKSAPPVLPADAALTNSSAKSLLFCNLWLFVVIM